MDPHFEIFDTTADAGVRAYAPSRAALLAPAGAGLYALIGELRPADEAEPLALELDGPDAPTLLHDYLTELLVLFERDRRMVTGVLDANLDDRRLRVSVITAAVDFDRSDCHREVKAVTYHELDIRPVAGGFEASYIVDL